MGVRVILQGIMFAVLTLIGFHFGKVWGGSVEAGQTMAFMVLAMSQIIQAFNMRSDKSLFKIKPFGNKTLNLAALTSLALVSLVLFTPVRIAFGLVILPAKLYILAAGLIMIPLVIMEFCKLIGLIKSK